MELVYLGIGLFVLLANCVVLFLLVRRQSYSRIAALLTNLQAGQLKQEQLFRDELGRSRVESAGIAREHRQEIVNSFQSLSDTVFGRKARGGGHSCPPLTLGLLLHPLTMGVVKKSIYRSFRIIDLAKSSFQIFGFKGVTRKILRNKELAPTTR